MQITFEVTLDYGEETPHPDAPTPDTDDVAAAVTKGLEAAGFPPVDVQAVRL